MNQKCLEHHGIKGQRWGIRRFQNKDGSLTKSGQNRYNKEMNKSKDEKHKPRTSERNNKKIGKLVSMKKEVKDLEDNLQEKETDEQKRIRMLNSTDPKELYENRQLLSTFELNERINRIDTEARLKSKIVEEKEKTGMEWLNEKMSKGRNTVDNATNFYRSLDNAYNTFANSTAGKVLENNLGISLPKGTKPKRQFNKEDFNKVWEKRKSMSDEEMRDFNNALQNELKAKQNIDKLNGRETGGNGKGMSRSDIEDMINDIINEREDEKRS